MRIIACIEGPVVIEKIFAHLDVKVAEPEVSRMAPSRRGLFDCPG
jgi:hypothetical protein